MSPSVLVYDDFRFLDVLRLATYCFFVPEKKLLARKNIKFVLSVKGVRGGTKSIKPVFLIRQASDNNT